MKTLIGWARAAPSLLLAHCAAAAERPSAPQACSRTSTRTSNCRASSPTARNSPMRRRRRRRRNSRALSRAEAAVGGGTEALRRGPFRLPAEPAAPPAVAERAPIREHIDALWPLLTRQTPTARPYASLLPLPRPYVVPGGRFRELYYWDSYFTMLGLAESGRRDLVADMVADFADLIDDYGDVPNGTRTYYLTRSQPPFFFAMVGLLSPTDPAAAFARYLPQLRNEYAFWMEGAADLTAGGAHRRVVALATGRSSIATGTTATRRATNPIARMSQRPRPRASRAASIAKSAPPPRAAGISLRAGSRTSRRLATSIPPRSFRSISTR